MKKLGLLGGEAGLRCGEMIARVERRGSRQAATLRPAIRLERPGDNTQGRTTAVCAAHDPTRGRVPRSSASAELQRTVPGRGQPLTRQMVQYRVLRASRRAKLSQDGVHILRHTFCSHLAMRGAPPRAIQELAGHRELGMTQRYMHLSPAALDSAIRLLDQPSVLQNFGDLGGRSPKERSMGKRT
jgi:Phage integrase family